MICHSDRLRPKTAWLSAWAKGDVLQAPRMQGKYHKMFPPVGYDYTIWVDASLQLGNVRRFVDFCLTALGDKDIALFRHPQHSSIFEEAEASLSHHEHKYAGLPVREQVASYFQRGLPNDHKLWAGGVIVRRSGVPWVEDVGADWWEECCTWTPQDQLSLPFVLWDNREQDSVATIPGSVYDGVDHHWVKGPDR